MAEVTDVDIVAGLPTTGTGTVPTLSKTNTVIGAVAETAPASDTASSGLNGRLQRIAQRLTTLITNLAPAAWTFGSGAIAAGTPRVALATDSPGIITTGTAGTPSAVVLSVQGVASGTTVPVTATMAASQLITPVDQYGQYETVAASQTAQTLGATGATGDYLAGVLVFPGTAGCGVVTVLDNATTIGTFPGGGTTALPSLVPFMIPVGLFSVSGAWKITTGANVTAVGVGKFT